MGKKAFFIVLIVILPFYVLAQDVDEVRNLYLNYVDSWNKGEIVDARLFLDSALKFESILSDYQMAIIYSGIGTIMQVQGRFDSSLYCLKKSASLLANNLEYRTQLAGANISIGNVYTSLREIDRAMLFYQKALREISDTENKTQYDISTELSALQNISSIYYERSEFRSSITSLRKSIFLRKVCSLGNLAQLYQNLASSYEGMGETDSASFYYKEAIREWINDHDNTYYQLAPTYLRYANFLHSLSNLKEAEEYYLLAINVYNSGYGELNPYTANAYVEFANFLLDSEHYIRAQDLINSALEILSGELAISEKMCDEFSHDPGFDINLFHALMSKTVLYDNWAIVEGNTERKLDYLLLAKESCNMAIDVLIRLFSSYISEESRLHLIGEKKDIYQLGINNAIKLYKFTNQEQYLEEAFQYCSLAKGAEIRTEITIRQMIEDRGIEDSLGIKIRASHQRIEAYYHILGEEQSILKDSKKRIDYINDQIFSSTNEYDSLINIAKHYPHYTNAIGEMSQLDTRKLQSNLGKNVALLEYFMVKKASKEAHRLIAFVVEENNISYFDTLLHVDIIEKIRILKEDHLNPYGNRMETISQDKKKEFTQISRELFSIFIDPLYNRILDKNLIIVPDEELNYLPFEILLTEDIESDSESYSSMPYLIRKHAVSYAYSSGMIFSSLQNTKDQTCFNTIIPEYKFLGDVHVSELQDAVDEAKSISKYFNCNTVLTGKINKDSFLDHLQSGACLHLAMHALSDTTDEHNTFLVLGQEKDSLVKCFDYEIGATMITSPMVILNACKTGSGIYHSGDGISSLARSFLLAGASSVIYSMWEIEDQVSARLMDKYYLYLSKGYMKNETLQKAKLDYLQSASPAYAHPKYWATIQLSGDISAIINNKHEEKLIFILIAIFTVPYLSIRLMRFIRVKAGSR